MLSGGVRKLGKKYYDSNLPIISIITVVYNAKTFLEKTIQSVINQTYPNIEYIIIDGGSTDGTIDIIKQYEDKIDYWQSEPDKGIYDAMNKGIMLTTGDWINFMNAGDIFVDYNVLTGIFRTQKFDNIDIIYGDSIEVNKNNENIIICSDNSDDLLKGPTYRHGASFVRSVVHKKNLFDLSRKDLGFALDYNLIYSLKNQNFKFYKVNTNVMKYEKEGISADIKKSAVYIFRITFHKKPIYACIKFLGINIKRIMGYYK